MVAMAAGLFAGSCATARPPDRGPELAALKSELKQERVQSATSEAQNTTRLEALTTTNLALVAGLEEEILNGEVTIKTLNEQLRLSMPQELLFDSGDAQLREPGQRLLDKVIDTMRENPGRRITVEGHTDDVKIGPTILAAFPTNWELSAGRAIAVVRYLEDNGIDPQDLGALGFGENRPVAENDTPEGRQQNRRIEVVLTVAPPRPPWVAPPEEQASNPSE
jgi:chemotaxis protein MotB